MRHSLLSIAISLLIAATAMLVLHGCGPRLSDAQAQAVADARAGALVLQEKRDAIAKASDPAAAAELEAQVLDALGLGSQGFFLAATADLKLPAPTFQPAVLRQQPAEATRYAAAGKAAALTPPKGSAAGFWALLGGGAVTALGLVLTLGKNLPGVGGVAFRLANVGWALLTPKRQKDAETQAAAVAEVVDDGLDIAIAYGEFLAVALKRAGQGALVEQAKDRASYLADKLGATDEVKRRLDLVRSGALHPELSISALPRTELPPAS